MTRGASALFFREKEFNSKWNSERGDDPLLDLACCSDSFDSSRNGEGLNLKEEAKNKEQLSHSFRKYSLILRMDYSERPKSLKLSFSFSGIPFFSFKFMIMRVFAPRILQSVHVEQA